MRKYFKAITKMSSNNWFEGIENRDPIEEIGQESISIKIILSFIFIPILLSPLYIYILSFFFMGIITISLRIYGTVRQEDKSIIGRELVCAWKSGQLLDDLIFFWPFDLLSIFTLALFRKTRSSFSSEYEGMCFNAMFSKNNGKYHGIHANTARDLSEHSIVLATEEAREVVVVTKETSRMAIVYSSLVSFIITPFGFLKANVAEEENNNNTVECLLNSNQSVIALSDLVILQALIVNIIDRLRRFFLILYHCINFIFCDKQIKKKWILPPIRVLPNMQIVSIITSAPTHGPPIVSSKT